MADQIRKPRNNDQRLEQMLDHMLQAYSDAKPRPGLETRVLAHLRAQELQPARGHRMWLWAALSAATLLPLLAVVLWQALQLPPPPVAMLPAAPEIKKPAPEFQFNPRDIPVPIQAQRQDQPALLEVKQEVFPSPTPLSEQEAAVLRYLARTPKEEVAANSHPDKPVEDGNAPLPQSQESTNSEGYNTR